MAITKEQPRTIHLGGEITEVNDISASGVITPGMLIERNAGQYRAHATAAGAVAQPVFALNQSELNKGVDDDYAASDLVHAAVGHPGSTFWALIGVVNATDGAALESAGDGTLQLRTTGEAVAVAIEAVNNGAGTARLRVEVL